MKTKNAKTAKIFISFLLVLLLAAFCVLSFILTPTVFADTSKSYDVHAVLSEFLSANPERTMGEGEQEKNAAEFIENKFKTYGYTDTKIGEFQVLTDGVTHTSYYTYVFKPAKSETKETAIVHAKLDNLSAYKINGAKIGGTGAYSGGAGISVLLTLSEELFAAQFDFNIIFLAHGASEFGGHGIKAFFSSEEYEELGDENVLTAIEFNRIGGGDYTYIYGDEIEKPHHNLFLESASGSTTLKKSPAYRRPAVGTAIDGLDYPYVHNGLASDNGFLLARKINTVTYESFNWEVLDESVAVEMKGLENVMHSDRDTIETLIARRGGVENLNANLSEIVNSVISGLTNKNFIAACRESVEEGNYLDGFLHNYLYISLAVSISGALIIFACAIIIIRRHQRQRIMEKYFSEFLNDDGVNWSDDKKKTDDKKDKDDGDIFEGF